jgi:hypothetical protein
MALLGETSLPRGVVLGILLQAGGILGALSLGPLIDRLGFYRVLAPSFLMGAVTIAAVGMQRLPMSLVCAAVLLSGVSILGGSPESTRSRPLSIPRTCVQQAWGGAWVLDEQAPSPAR